MNQIKLKSSFPHVWGDLAFQNQWLRLGMMACLTVSVLSLVTTSMLLRRRPAVIALDTNANLIRTQDSASPEAEVDQAARKYAEFRYTWTPDTQGARLARAKFFVAPQSMKAYEKTISELQAFSKGKSIGQRIYLTSINIDPKANRVQLVGDRFTEIQGLKAATVLRVTLTYQTGTRTLDNPWGIYIVKEEEAQ